MRSSSPENIVKIYYKYIYKKIIEDNQNPQFTFLKRMHVIVILKWYTKANYVLCHQEQIVISYVIRVSMSGNNIVNIFRFHIIFF